MTSLETAERIAALPSTMASIQAVLDPAAIKAKWRLFMTATPRYFTGRVLREAKEADYEVASMDDHTRFGKVFHRLTFGEAIDRKLLTDYQVAIIGVDDATYREWAERGTVVTLDGRKLTDARSLAGQIGLAKAMRKFDLRRMNRILEIDYPNRRAIVQPGVINVRLTQAVAEAPEQWFWQSRRFRHRPPGETPGPDGLPPLLG